ncbi:MAG TPA: hypothetical protein VEX60_05445 [Pyrinomonadaceae bacterium]|nr:hypothetical protein [Pyrinomonadaceae bacterium]
MSKTIALEIPEAEVSSLESALDKALAALRGANGEADDEREERISRLRAETHVLMQQIRTELQR